VKLFETIKRGVAAAALLAMSVTLLCGCGAEKPDPNAPADPSINAENAQYWREVLQNYRGEDSVQQIMLVRYTGGCSAIVKYYEKCPEENNAWALVFEEEDAYVGKFGIDKTKEGDAKTPTGDLGVLFAFGLRENPGTALAYVDITPDTYACDEDCPYYNTIVDIRETGHDCKGEDMYRFSPEYNYGFATDYNADCTAGAGSAIFVHCKGEKAFTGGCVAISEENMRTVLTTADSGMRVVIGEN